MTRPRIGAVSYLNTKPLVEGLEELAIDYEIAFDLPSRLADDLQRGDYQVALIPSIEVIQSRVGDRDSYESYPMHVLDAEVRFGASS